MILALKFSPLPFHWESPPLQGVRGPGRQARGKEVRGLGRSSFPERLVGPEETIAEAPQRPLRSHHVGTQRGNTCLSRVTGPMFPKNLSWVPQFGDRLCQVMILTPKSQGVFLRGPVLLKLNPETVHQSYVC